MGQAFLSTVCKQDEEAEDDHSQLSQATVSIQVISSGQAHELFSFRALQHQVEKWRAQARKASLFPEPTQRPLRHRRPWLCSRKHPLA